MNDYVVAAFSVVWFVLLVYVAFVALRTGRIGREVELLTRLVERSEHTPGTGDDPGRTPL